MSSTIGNFYHIKPPLSGSHSYNATSANEDKLLACCGAFSLLVGLVVYFAVLALMVILFFLAVRCLGNLGNMRTAEEAETTETNPLCPSPTTRKSITFTYGTYEADIESGDCKGGSDPSTSRNTSSEDLYDGKLCVICYDQKRECFFVPCGHCATCYVCAQRIFHGENRVCPMCRRLIGKVRRFFAEIPQ